MDAPPEPAEAKAQSPSASRRSTQHRKSAVSTKTKMTNLYAILILGVYLAALRLEFLRFALVVGGALRLRGSCRKCWLKVSFKPNIEARVVLVFERSTGWRETVCHVDE
jgi:hypothetical protein